MGRRSLALLISVAVTGCGIIRQQQIDEQIAALRQQSALAFEDCNRRFLGENPKNAVSRAQCTNAAFAIIEPTLPYPDLLHVFMTQNLAIAEDVQHGRLTVAQGNAAMMQKLSDLVGEEQRRSLTGRSVAAQESAAAAAWAPRSCNLYGNTATCF
jgi:hypothetical protein